MASVSSGYLCLLKRLFLGNLARLLINNKISVSSELAKDPEATPRDVVARFLERADGQSPGEPRSEKLPVPDSKDLEVAFQCGKWGSQRPSDLFLKIYQDALCSLAKDLMSGLVSPSLMGSCGVVPMTIIGPLPDICRHMSNCIVRAEKEVILMTSYWIYSDNSRFLTNAMRELSHRAGLRGTKVVIKMMYDRGNLKQFLNNRQPVCAKQVVSSKIQLPGPQEIPNIDLQVLNYHRPVAGTLHSKFMIVDRKVALLESNNIQGPIVDSFYDMALISWSVALNPPLPLIDTPAASMAPPSYPFLFTNHGRNDSVWSSQGDPATIYAEKPEDKLLPEHTPDEPHYDTDIVAETARITASLTPRPEETRRDCVTRHLSITGDAPEWDEEDQMTPYILHPPHEPFPMAMVNREPWGALNHSSIYTPQNAAFLAAIGNAEHSVFIQTPNLNAERLLAPLLDAVRRGVIVTCFLCLGYNDAGKDQTRPIHNKFKKRSCHIKLMIIDEKVAIQGSANLDTQSFFHSQETNVLLDSPLICRSWLDALCRNQNTATYGAVSKVDGCWHDPETGEIAVGSIGTDPGRFSWMRGIVGAIKRVRGVGGF
ncbi:hypothetical protein CIHG_03709 [Coccidioides immitis H538.4]|uniref:PLD phosphodiesterase domain-containing protein n=1 Tax=Coccidioides immitis H538.4 TaxID=396776 RepID=A0A0J8RNW1_COCIT|nr:hypothetical protein CIHG_03709 [Coccidioides immitis H538.4]